MFGLLLRISSLDAQKTEGEPSQDLCNFSGKSSLQQTNKLVITVKVDAIKNILYSKFLL